MDYCFKRQWNQITKLPLENKWSFSEEGIIIDRTFSIKKVGWDRIQKVTEGYKFINFFQTDNRVINIIHGQLPRVALNDEQYLMLHTILLKYLDSSKVKLKIDKKIANKK